MTFGRPGAASGDEGRVHGVDGDEVLEERDRRVLHGRTSTRCAASPRILAPAARPIQHVTAAMYCEQMTFTPGKGVGC